MGLGTSENHIVLIKKYFGKKSLPTSRRKSAIIKVNICGMSSEDGVRMDL
jgi:hypothetical protein